jgi:hypothetical protein
MATSLRALAASAVLVASAALAPADVVVLVNGDRVSGKVLGSVSRRVRLQTPYGTLVVPRAKVERILRDDGREEIVNAPPAAPAPPPAPPPPPPPRLELVVSGDTFWQAWDPKAAPADPSLRLELRLDEQLAVAYTDANLDPEDLPKAVVNSFVFSPERLFVTVGERVVAGPPVIATRDTAGGHSGSEIRLPVELPAELAGERRLRLAYQVNEGTSTQPVWRVVTEAAATVALAPGQTARVRAQQSRGTMEFSRKKMRNVESFTATLSRDALASAAP